MQSNGYQEWKNPLWTLATVVREIKGLLRGWEISFIKVSRSANGVVDFFAKQGVDLTSQGIYFCDTEIVPGWDLSLVILILFLDIQDHWSDDFVFSFLLLGFFTLEPMLFLSPLCTCPIYENSFYC